MSPKDRYSCIQKCLRKSGASGASALGLPYHRDDVGRPDAAELRQMPTLAVSQADDLKIDTGETRVWLARTGVEDGEPFDNKVTIERLVKGRWEVEATYPGGLSGSMLPQNLPQDPYGGTQHGFYVMGQHASVAWARTREEAEKLAKQLNYRGGANYTVVEAPPIGTHGPIGAHGLPEAEPIKTFHLQVGEQVELAPNAYVKRKGRDTYVLHDRSNPYRNRWGTLAEIVSDANYYVTWHELPPAEKSSRW